MGQTKATFLEGGLFTFITMISVIVNIILRNYPAMKFDFAVPRLQGIHPIIQVLTKLEIGVDRKTSSLIGSRFAFKL